MQRVLVFIFGIIVAISSCKNRESEAIAFADVVVQDQRALFQMEEQLLDAIIELNFTEVNRLYPIYQEFIQQLKSKYEQMKPFDDEDEFRKAFLQLIYTVETTSQNEYAQLIKLAEKLPSVEQMSEEDYNQFKQIIEAIDAKTVEANNHFLAAQETFARKYNLTLVETKNTPQ